jgi:O-antigen/teichoic acid export membrane protein
MGKFRIVYKEMSLPVKASFWYLVCSVFQKGLSLITTPIFTRILTTSEYGTINIYTSWEAIIIIFATLYLNQGVYNNGMVNFREERDQYNLTMQTVTSILTVCIFGIYMIGKNFWNDILGLNTEIVILMFIDIFFTAAMSFWSIRNRYEYKYKSVVALTMIGSVLSTVISLTLVLIMKDMRAEAKIIGQVATRVLLYSAIYGINVKKGKVLFNIKYAKYALAFNVPLLPHYLSTAILNQSDRIMINNMIGTAEAGIYGLAYNAAMLMTIVTASLNSSFAPWMYEEMAANRFKNIGKSAIKLIALVGFLCLTIVVFAPEIIFVLGSSAYHSAIWIIPPITMSVMLIFVYCCFANVEFYFEKKKIILVGSLFSAGINLVLNVIFIPMFGFIAAGYTTLISYIAFALFHYMSMVNICKEKNVNNPYNGSLVLAVCSVYIVLALFCNLLYLNNSIRFIAIAVGAVVALFVGVKYKVEIVNMFKKKENEHKN